MAVLSASVLCTASVTARLDTTIHAPLVTEPLLEGDDFISGYSDDPGSPEVAVFIDGVKVATVPVDTSATPVAVTYPSGTFNSWPWSCDLSLLNPTPQLTRRSRVTARTVVAGVWSDLSPNAIVRTQFFRRNLVNLLPPEFTYQDTEQPADSFVSDGSPEQTFALSDTSLDAAAINTVRVADTAWTRVSTLDHAGPQDEVYVLTHAPDGTISISFGDDTNGKIPPDGDAITTGRGQLASFIRVFAITMDELKDYIDSFTEVFDLERCEPKYLPYIAAILGYDLNLSDPVEVQRRHLRHAVAWYKVKGTEESFRIMFFAMGYRIRLYELWTTTGYLFQPGLPPDIRNLQDQLVDLSGLAWTENYKIFTTALPGYSADTLADSVPQDEPLLLENGGSWYKSPHFAIEFTSIDVPHLTADGLRYIMGRVNQIRPAHTVLEYLRFLLNLKERVDPPIESYLNEVTINLREKGWFLGYCDPSDPVYYRSGINFPSGFPTRNGTDAVAISLKREQVEGKCHPPEIVDIHGNFGPVETYGLTLRRDGMNLIPSSGAVDMSTVDPLTWPVRAMPQGDLDRSGNYRYLNPLVLTLS